jgi:small nuclear ribonucleoprotein (snRNP)-like protein
MTALAITIVACGTIVVLVAMWLRRPDQAADQFRSVLDERLLEYVVVTLKSGTSFGGVLYVEDSGALVLAKAEHLRDDGTKIPADGEIILLRSDVDFIQRP